MEQAAKSTVALLKSKNVPYRKLEIYVVALLSYLLFEPEFFQLQFDQAEHDAQRKLKEWKSAPAQAAQ